jgi:hypothetical protein
MLHSTIFVWSAKRLSADDVMFIFGNFLLRDNSKNTLDSGCFNLKLFHNSFDFLKFEGFVELKYQQWLCQCWVRRIIVLYSCPEVTQEQLEYLPKHFAPSRIKFFTLGSHERKDVICSKRKILRIGCSREHFLSLISRKVILPGAVFHV